MRYLWIPKRVMFVATNFGHIIASEKCPDQRIYRRLNRSEREEYLRASSS